MFVNAWLGFKLFTVLQVHCGMFRLKQEAHMFSVQASVALSLSLTSPLDFMTPLFIIFIYKTIKNRNILFMFRTPLHSHFSSLPSHHIAIYILYILCRKLSFTTTAHIHTLYGCRQVYLKARYRYIMFLCLAARGWIYEIKPLFIFVFIFQHILFFFVACKMRLCGRSAYKALSFFFFFGILYEYGIQNVIIWCINGQIVLMEMLFGYIEYTHMYRYAGIQDIL